MMIKIINVYEVTERLVYKKEIHLRLCKKDVIKT